MDGDQTSSHQSDTIVKEEKKFTEKIETSKGKTVAEKTDTKSREKDSLKVKGEGAGEKGSVSVSSNSVDNKENETKGDDT